MVIIRHQGYRLSKSGEENPGLFGLRVNHFPALVIAAAGTRLVRLLPFMAIRTFGERRRSDDRVRAVYLCAVLNGVALDWALQLLMNSPPFRGQNAKLSVAFYCFLNQSCLRRASGASLASAACFRSGILRY